MARSFRTAPACRSASRPTTTARTRSRSRSSDDDGGVGTDTRDRHRLQRPADRHGAGQPVGRRRLVGRVQPRLVQRSGRRQPVGSRRGLGRRLGAHDVQQDSTGSLGTQSHTYADNTTPPATGYTVTVKVTDKDGEFGTATFNVIISNVRPSLNTPVFAFNPFTGARDRNDQVQRSRLARHPYRGLRVGRRDDITRCSPSYVENAPA